MFFNQKDLQYFAFSVRWKFELRYF